MKSPCSGQQTWSRPGKQDKGMPLGPSIRTQIGTLVIATSIIQLANGFFGTFISLRVAIEGFDAPGPVLSAYFCRLHPGGVSLRQNHRTDWSRSAPHARICWLGR